jgi:hypothetical protein
VNGEQLAHWRMRTQRLTGEPLKTPEEVVGRLGAVQSQDYAPAKWSLGQRTPAEVDDTAVEQAVADGAILRTHVLRPTWHFVLPEDVVWMLELTGPRVHVQNGYRRLGLDEELLAKTGRMIADALRGGNQLTRKQLADVLSSAGVERTGFRLGYVLMHAELTGLICSGAPAGKHQAYALLADRAPQAKSLSRDDALAELTRRYFTGHGPATVKDFRWWSSLTLADIQRGLEMVGHELQCETYGGLTYWFAELPPATVPDGPRVDLLQTYDECIVGYSESRGVLDVAGLDKVITTGGRPVYNHAVFLDGQVVGRWKRTLRTDTVHIETILHTALDEAQTRALQAAADAHGAFVGRTATVAVTG